MTKPMPTAMTVSSMCSTRRGWKVLLQWLENQSQQNWRFSRTQSEPRWNVGMTGPPCAIGSASWASTT